ncbi:MAG: geranyl transferase [Planctomycetales bacterium]|nr:geranyl transferase [Planctomycetales bacterium]MCA9169723.1 geranyl transferase [Planctomycetales bacterium]
MLNYLESLTVQLAQAAAELPAAVRDRHARFLREQLRADGGFAGREGGSDLYYTGFGLRSLAILGELDDEIAARAREFLRSRLQREESIVDFFSLIYGAKLLEAANGDDLFADQATDWADAVSKFLLSLRRTDGGFAKGAAGTASSTYHSFLVLLCLQLIDRPLPEPDRLVEFILSQACDEGGFREIRVSKRAGTNPTAAAIGVLQILDCLHDATRNHTVQFLCEMQTDSGGLRANTRIPIADGLSTFTGLWSLNNLNPDAPVDWQAAGEYIASLENSDGGFHGAEWDLACDVEYTFYGLASMALIQSRTG